MNKPKTMQQLKNNIHADIRGLTTGTLSKVMQSVQIRMQLCIQENGGYLPDINFHN